MVIEKKTLKIEEEDEIVCTVKRNSLANMMSKGS